MNRKIIVSDKINRAAYKLARAVWRCPYMDTDQEISWSYGRGDDCPPAVRIIVEFKKPKLRPKD